ncbi:MAG: MerR family transcriptional regulator, partial [Acidimicrobiales bacterium]|nr:MerR family transcriptional regulator [Acidimicrobiales bacterium]
GLRTSTIRYWTKEGLLKVAMTTESGYRWYAESAVDKVANIKGQQAKRRTLEEIKRDLAN